MRPYQKEIKQMAADFSLETMEAGRKWHNIFNCWKKGSIKLESRNLAKVPFRNEGAIKTFSDEGKVRVFEELTIGITQFEQQKEISLKK